MHNSALQSDKETPLIAVELKTNGFLITNHKRLQNIPVKIQQKHKMKHTKKPITSIPDLKHSLENRLLACGRSQAVLGYGSPNKLWGGLGPLWHANPLSPIFLPPLGSVQTTELCSQTD